MKFEIFQIRSLKESASKLEELAINNNIINMWPCNSGDSLYLIVQYKPI